MRYNRAVLRRQLDRAIEVRHGTSALAVLDQKPRAGRARLNGLGVRVNFACEIGERSIKRNDFIAVEPCLCLAVATTHEHAIVLGFSDHHQGQRLLQQREPVASARWVVERLKTTSVPIAKSVAHGRDVA